MRAVISEPERSAASITTTPSDRPEMSRLRRGKWRAVGWVPRAHSATASPDSAEAVVQPGILRRVDDVEAAGQHRQRAGGEGALMRRGVDAAGEAGDHGEAGLAQLPRHVTGEAAAVQRGVAGADDADHRPGRQLAAAAQRQHRRGVLDRGQDLGIVGLAGGDEAAAGPGQRLQLALRLGDGGRLQPGPPAAAARQLGQRLDRGARPSRSGRSGHGR